LTTTTVQLEARGRDSTRLAVLTWAGPGQPVKLGPGSTLHPLERQAVLAYLTSPKPPTPSDAEGPAGPELEDWYPTASVEGLTVALTGLAAATGVHPRFDTAEGLALEDLEDAAP